MRVFVTGATGFVGSAVVAELIKSGHSVLGLARSESGSAALRAAGAETHAGTLEDLDSLTSGAAATDGVIHTAFNHDFSKFAENCVLDRQAIAALGAGLDGTEKPLLVTAGIAGLAPGRIATETDAAPASSPAYPRASEDAATALLARGVRVSVMRLPPSVHGIGDHGFVPMLIDLARAKGVSAYIGDGLNRWPAVHRFDAARLYRLAIEHGAGGLRYHATAEQGIPLKEIAGVIGRRLQLPVVALSPEEAADHFGWFVHFAAMDVPSASAQTRALLGWEPEQPGLIADLDQASYFAA